MTMQATRPAVTVPRLGRAVAAVFGVAALFFFFQPWVSASLPNVGDSRLTGMELARGETAARVDEAVFGSLSAQGSAGAKNTSRGSSAAPVSSGLALPTRVPTVAAGSATGFGGLTLPTRVPTVAPGASGAFSHPRATTSAPGIATPGGSTVAIGRQITRAEPEHLPQLLLFAVPLAAAGITVFSLIWERLRDPRDIQFGKWWTVLLSFGGTFGVGYVLYKVMTAPRPNDLLGPGEVHAAEWGLWGAFIAFLLSAVVLAVAWLSPAPPAPPVPEA